MVMPIDSQNQKIQTSRPVLCKLCQSQNTRKYGFVEGVQKYFCNDCRRKFGDDDRLFRMKTPYPQVASALEDYYLGKSINIIRNGFNIRYSNSPPSSKTVYEWITKYTREAIKQFKDYQPHIGGILIIEETELKLNGKNCWCCDIVDKDTRFLLATKISLNRSSLDIKTLLKRAGHRAGKLPEKILIDRCGGYGDGLEQDLNTNFKGIVIDYFDESDSTELIEEWHRILKNRTKNLGDLKSLKTANKFLDGFLVWYNYLRPQELLNGLTPAEKAEVNYTSKNWADILRNLKPELPVRATPAGVV
jgi:putative transposase